LDSALEALPPPRDPEPEVRFSYLWEMREAARFSHMEYGRFMSLPPHERAMCVAHFRAQQKLSTVLRRKMQPRQGRKP